jgi:DNA-binding LacI/PurR family transcriptional regulator
MSARVSIATVAHAAGVSAASVSNAYNRPERLSAEARERILAVAHELGYAGPDPAARSLRSGKAAAIGVLFTAGLAYAFYDPYCVEVLRGVAEVAERTRTSVVLMPIVVHTATLTVEQTRESVRGVRQAVIDGAIADGIADGHPALEVLQRRGLPLVRSVDDPDARCVLVDDRGGARQIGRHLATLGHRDVAVLVDTPSTQPLAPYGRLRLDGIRKGLGPGARVTVVTADGNSIEAGRAATARLLADSPPSAIAAISDALALGALQAARTPGAPAVAVTGFDDVSAAAAAELTTVRQPTLEKGRLMGRMLLDPEFAQRRVLLPTELVIRRSTVPVH